MIGNDHGGYDAAVSSAPVAPDGEGATVEVPDPLEPPWGTPPRPGRRRQPLSRGQIVEAAIRILDAEGADALTVRRLGDELGTGSATLYWHIGGRDELGELIYDHVMSEITLPEPDPARWKEQLTDLGRQAYRAMLAHRDVVRYSIGRVPVGPNMLRVMEWSLGLLRAAGIPDVPAAYFGDIFGRFLDASVLEVTTAGGTPPEEIGRHFARLPAERFPHLTALLPQMMGTDDDDRFEFGLRLLVEGLATYAAEESPPA